MFLLIVDVIGELRHFLRGDAQRTSGVGANCRNHIRVDVGDQPFGFLLGLAGGFANLAAYAFAEVFPGLFRFRVCHLSPPLSGLPGDSIIAVAIQGGQFEWEQAEPELPCGLQRRQNQLKCTSGDNFRLGGARCTRGRRRRYIANSYSSPGEQLAWAEAHGWKRWRDQADDAGKYQRGP